MTTTTTRLARSGIVFCRVVQATLSVFAATLTAGGLSAEMNALSFAMLGVLALVLLGFVGVVELLAVAPLRRRFGGDAAA